MPKTRASTRAEATEEKKKAKKTRRKKSETDSEEEYPETPSKDGVDSNRNKRKLVKKKVTIGKAAKKSKTVKPSLGDSVQSLAKIGTKRRREVPAGVDSEDQILKAFDMDIKFGGCMGISRLNRWKRARKFNLDPPEAVKKILDKYDETDSINECLWEARV